MLKLRVEFFRESELNEYIALLEEKYEIIDMGTIRKSKKKGCSMSLVYIEVIPKRNEDNG